MNELVIVKSALFVGITALLVGYAAIALVKVFSASDETECESSRRLELLSVKARFHQSGKLIRALAKVAAWCLVAFGFLLCLLIFQLVTTIGGRFM